MGEIIDGEYGVKQELEIRSATGDGGEALGSPDSEPSAYSVS